MKPEILKFHVWGRKRPSQRRTQHITARIHSLSKQLPLFSRQRSKLYGLNLLNAELNPIRHLLALVGARHIVHVSRIRVNAVNKAS